MNFFRRHISGSCVPAATVFFVFLATSSALLAQTAPIADRLSSSTVLYVQWHGRTSLAGAEKKNHVLQLLEDPALAPFWLAVTTRLQQGAQKNPAAISDSDLRDAMSLLDNAAVFGLTANPEPAFSSAPESTTNPFAFFAVYDTTGKTALIQKWKGAGVKGSSPSTQVTNYDFGGTSVEVRTSGKDTTYDAQARNYFLFASQKRTIEDLITRFRGEARPAASLSQLPAWQEMQKYMGTDDALEFFARIPDVNEWKLANVPAAVREQLARNLHLEKVHAIGGGISLAAEATRFHGAILGDTSPDGPFDLASASKAVFQTQAAVNGSSTFTMSRFDLPAAYRWIRSVAVASASPQQAGGIPALEAMAQGFLGMPVADALALFTGELASVSTYSDDGTVETLYAISIQKPEAVLRVLRAVLGTKIAAEDTSGGITYLDIAIPSTDAKTGTRRKSFYYAAVTPELIFVAPRKPMLRQAVERLRTQTTASPATGIFANPQYAQMRSRLPEKLSALSASDFSQIPWGAMLARFADQAAQAGKDAKNSQPPDWGLLKSITPDVINQHLHMSLGGWWKDSTGVYFESYIQ